MVIEAGSKSTNNEANIWDPVKIAESFINSSKFKIDLPILMLYRYNIAPEAKAGTIY